MFHILVVEDNADMRELFCTVLSDSGYQCLPASNGLDALEIMDREYVDLIVADIMMPGMDGYELTKTLLFPQTAAQGRAPAFLRDAPGKAIPEHRQLKYPSFSAKLFSEKPEHSGFCGGKIWPRSSNHEISGLTKPLLFDPSLIQEVCDEISG